MKSLSTMSTTFTHPPRPPSLTISKACTYKTVSTTSKSISIPIDIYLPPNPPKNDVPHPIMLFIHGGGWTGGNRTDYCRPLFHRFLAQNFIVASMDYRLLPETPLAGQLEDIRDVEPWLRGQLAPLLKADGFDVEVENGEIVVVGASAGAHLALLTVRSPLPFPST
jgi:acetyl esterase/lipase